MLTVQEIFDLAIETNTYNPDDPLMCPCLSTLYLKGQISWEEFNLALKEIRGYIGNRYDTLEYFLTKNFFDIYNGRASFDERKKIYQDWKNKPELWDITI